MKGANGIMGGFRDWKWVVKKGIKGIGCKGKLSEGI